MSYHYAWVEITGKVFVSQSELEERLREKYPEYKAKVDADEESLLSASDVCTYQEQTETFQELAQEKIHAMFPTDEPIKFNEAIIDMESYQHP